MKKWFVMALLVCVAAAVQAAEGEGKKKEGAKGGDVTKAQFIENAKKQADKKGTEFDQAKVEANFAKMDKNSDGKLSADEKSAGKGKKEKAPKVEE